PGASGAVDPAMSRSACLFVVRGSGRAPLLYKLPLATYHAYNFTGGGCFYVNPPRSASPPGSKVTLHRPGGGIGGEVWGALDHTTRARRGRRSRTGMRRSSAGSFAAATRPSSARTSTFITIPSC